MWWIALAFILILIVYYWPKGLWIVFGGATVLVAAVFFLNHQQEAKRSLVTFEVAYSPDACPADKPMHVTITNEAEESLDRVLFTIHARMPGYSSIVTPYTYRQNTSEKILQHGEKYSSCYPVPVLTRTAAATLTPESLEWSAEADKVFFQ